MNKKVYQNYFYHALPLQDKLKALSCKYGSNITGDYFYILSEMYSQNNPKIDINFLKKQYSIISSTMSVNIPLLIEHNVFETRNDCVYSDDVRERLERLNQRRIYDKNRKRKNAGGNNKIIPYDQTGQNAPQFTVTHHTA